MNFSPDRIIDYNSLKIAVVHEWLVDYSGSERVVEQILNIFPQADLFAIVEFLPDNLKYFIRNKQVKTSFIQKLPGARKYYRQYLPLMPLAVEQFDLSGYDIVISSNHAVAKGVITGPDQLHISYVHSPIRYAWDMTHQYLRESGLNKGPKSWLARWFLHKIRIWDNRTANGVDRFVCNSRFIAKRINKVYRREAEVINPPVNIDGFELGRQKEDYYVTVSRLVPYKKVDLIVEAFSGLPSKKLIVIGDGPDMNKIRSKAAGNVQFLGYRSFEDVKKYMQTARAFVFAAEEDFGIVPVEAQACGTPVIAFGKGGALETVIENETGLFFREQTAASLVEAVERFETLRHQFNPDIIRINALKYSEEQFRKKFKEFVDQALVNYFGPKENVSYRKSAPLKNDRDGEPLDVFKREAILK